MQIPGREDHALVIPTDTLPARYEQAVMDILMSPEGQNEETFANVLGRRLMPDTGKPVLTALHEGNMLIAVPVSNILMMPMPNMPFPLTTILEGMGKTIPKSKDGPSPAQQHAAVEKYNQIAVNQKVEGIENRRAIAQNLLIEAEMLENAGKKKRDEAYKIAPEMAPVVQPPEWQFRDHAPHVQAPVEQKKPRATRAKKSA
ncbi:unnamed protein product [Sphagnum tenellum]